MRDTDTGEARTGTERLVKAVCRRYPIHDERLLAALRSVDRRFFLESSAAAQPYEDRSYSIRRGDDGTRLSSSTAPSLSALMIQALRLEPGNGVLEIGTASGYNAALLSQVVGPLGSVVSVDVDPELVTLAASHLRHAGIDGVAVRHADGWHGQPDHAPFDAIVATMACWAVSPAWMRQLRPGGRFVAPLWFGPDFEAVASLRQTQHGLQGTLIELCSFNKPRGEAGGPRLSIGDPSSPDFTLNVSAQLGSDAAILRRGRAVIATEPTYTDAGKLGPLWFRRVALADPGAFVIRRYHDTSRVIATGIVELETSSGAWLETHYRRDPAHPNSLVIDMTRWAHVGGTDTLTRLQRYSTEPRAIELANLDIQIAAPSTAPPTDEAPDWELHRRGLVLRLWDRQ